MTVMNLNVFWDSPTQWRCPVGVWFVGVGAVWLYATFHILWPELAEHGELVAALLGLVMVLAYGKGVRGSAALWLLLAAVVVQILSWTLGYYHHPEWVTSNPQLDRLGKLFIFIGVAWWLGGSTRNTLWLWGLGLFGLLAATFVQGGGLDEWIRGLQGRRVDFDIRNAQHTAMFFGVGSLGLVALGKRCCYPGRLVIWRFALWLLALTVCLAGVVVTQTRAVGAAFGAALVVMGAAWWLWHVASHGLSSLFKPVSLVVSALAVVVALGMGTWFYDATSKRIAAESQTIAHILQGEFDEMPYSTGLGLRLHTWRAAAEWIAERPLVGWGEKGRGLVIDHTDWLPDDVKERFGHLHNIFLEIWVAYGLLGLAVMGALAFWVARGVWLSWHGGVLPGDLALFATGFFVYWLIVNQFEAYSSFSTGVYVHNLILGGLVTHYWQWKSMEKKGVTRSGS
ncbi:hypothetical protein GCM10007160_41750 [Litchfieldella qijiaojingensis]|uniref:O-antigen ligase-related domain-containing protein n=1 Tax=Litchfieldella qijiaojingensis TaxID=980347 RepID=A0ABQ2ZAC4_9GAMM|nr:O-antigen ligase family protein [Halomonas qijiaojingensis]GGY10203.1 hypothetical protein GCM10007160_41750 [Halomonas qijiaojingensis]